MVESIENKGNGLKPISLITKGLYGTYSKELGYSLLIIKGLRKFQILKNRER